MKAEYRRELTKNTLILKDDHECDQTSYQVRILDRTTIPGILHCHTQMLNGELYFHYDTSNFIQLHYYYVGNPIKREDMERFLKAVQAVIKDVREYLLDASSILLDPEYIFVESGGTDFGFCYVPGMIQTFETAFGKIAEFFLERLDHNDKEAVVLGYGVYRAVKSGHACLDHLLDLLNEDGKEESFLVVPEKEDKKKVPLPESSKSRKVHVKKNNKGFSLKLIFAGIFVLMAGIYTCWRSGLIGRKTPVNNGSIIEAGESADPVRWYYVGISAGILIVIAMLIAIVVICRKKKKSSLPKGLLNKNASCLVQDPTVFLEDVMTESRHKLLDMITQEEFILGGKECYIGKLSGRGGLLLDYETVSRKHARMSIREGEWYIEDCGSSNGTFVNNYRLDQGEMIQLIQGDELRFADREYLFL